MKVKKLIEQLFKFGIVGIIAFVIDYSVLALCHEVFHINVLVSSAIAFTISVIVNYILSIRWVFDVNKNSSEKRNFILFIVLSLIGLALTELIMWCGTELLSINYLIVKIIATGIVMVFNFITRKIFLEK